jgi:drug/metabolite transporter (DMT)-like permease
MHTNWFFIALIPAILWSIVNHIDKYILSKHFKGNGIGGIFLFSSLFSVVVLPCIVFLLPIYFLNISFLKGLILLFVGIINAIAFYLYLRALNEEETSVVIPLLQMIPVFAYLLGYPILGEVLSVQQLMSAAVVMLGVTILSLDFDLDNRKILVRKKILTLIAYSSLLFALHDVLFKRFTTEDSFLVSAFWQHAGLTVTGVVVYLFNREYREQFKTIFKLNTAKVLSLNLISEFLYILGNLANSFATLLAPVALVLVVSSYQPLFVFIIGTVLTIFLPNISTEKLSLKHLIQKLLSIIIILIGSYFLYFSSTN